MIADWKIPVFNGIFCWSKLANGQFNDGDDDDDVDNLCSALCLRHSSGRSLPPASHHEDDDGFHDNDLDRRIGTPTAKSRKIKDINLLHIVLGVASLVPYHTIVHYP